MFPIVRLSFLRRCFSTSRQWPYSRFETFILDLMQVGYTSFYTQNQSRGKHNLLNHTYWLRQSNENRMHFKGLTRYCLSITCLPNIVLRWHSQIGYQAYINRRECRVDTVSLEGKHSFQVHFGRQNGFSYQASGYWLGMRCRLHSFM